MKYPPLRLDHLLRMTDSVGMLQHSIYTLPDPQLGYTLDDNARAFVVALLHHQQTRDPASLELGRRYLSFIRYAQTPDGRFVNFLRYDRRWREELGSPDSNGRAIWALGYGIANAPELGMRKAADHLLQRALPHIKQLCAPRAMAFALLGFAEAFRAEWQPRESLALVEYFAASLAALFDASASDDWQWFEPYLTYSNATLAQAMIVASALTGDRRYRIIARDSLDFIIATHFRNGMLDLVGQNGWYSRNGERTLFDQQPIDAGCTVEALDVAQELLGEPRYGDLATIAVEWFYGRNRNNIALYDPETGGCYDGLVPDGVNRNQGAESTLAHLTSRLLTQEDMPEWETVHAAQTLSR